MRRRHGACRSIPSKEALRLDDDQQRTTPPPWAVEDPANGRIARSDEETDPRALLSLRCRPRPTRSARPHGPRPVAQLGSMMPFSFARPAPVHELHRGSWHVPRRTRFLRQLRIIIRCLLREQLLAVHLATGPPRTRRPSHARPRSSGDIMPFSLARASACAPGLSHDLVTLFLRLRLLPTLAVGVTLLLAEHCSPYVRPHRAATSTRPARPRERGAFSLARASACAAASPPILSLLPSSSPPACACGRRHAPAG